VDEEEQQNGQVQQHPQKQQQHQQQHPQQREEAIMQQELQQQAAKQQQSLPCIAGARQRAASDAQHVTAPSATLPAAAGAGGVGGWGCSAYSSVVAWAATGGAVAALHHKHAAR
jgi:hypothetical protein